MLEEQGDRPNKLGMTNDRANESDGPEQPESKRQKLERSSSSDGTSSALFIK